MSQPRCVGIKAIEIYFPNTCVDQNDLEAHDGVSQGKYTIGLGQLRMGFCDDREDIYSMSLTAVSRLLKNYGIDRRNIGRLEVGTETLLDKSKSVKSVLMQLFSDVNNDIGGVDNINACYGGTSALLNTIDWCESSAWDGRDAIVVAGDIAIYGKGNARPSGGAGVVAMLVGHDAPLEIVPGLRGHYFQHVYDFYKPDMRSEYPMVQGKYSMECYIKALDEVYGSYKRREKQLAAQAIKAANSPSAKSIDSGFEDSEAIPDTEIEVTISEPKVNSSKLFSDRFDYMIFHSPVAKLVSKAYGRIAYHDFREDPSHPDFASLDSSLADLSYEESLVDRALEKTFAAHTAPLFAQRVRPGALVPVMNGNMYTASLYSGLASMIAGVSPEDIRGRTIGMFSYGSGLASTMFAIRVRGDTSEIRKTLRLEQRLADRLVKSPTEFEEALESREQAHLKSNFQPKGPIDTLVSGTYYLTNIDDQYRRFYAIA